MNRFKNWVVLTLGMGGLVVGTMVGTAPLAYAVPPTQVEVVNTPLPVNAAQRGTWNVGLVGTPTVQLAPRNIFRQRLTPDGTTPLTWTNPTGSRAVLETVSARFDAANPQFSFITYHGLIVLPPTNPVYFFAGSLIGPSGTSGQNSYVLTAPVQIYVEPGETVEVSIASGVVMLSGHYE